MKLANGFAVLLWVLGSLNIAPISAYFKLNVLDCEAAFLYEIQQDFAQAQKMIAYAKDHLVNHTALYHTIFADEDKYGTVVGVINNMATELGVNEPKSVKADLFCAQCNQRICHNRVHDPYHYEFYDYHQIYPWGALSTDKVTMAWVPLDGEQRIHYCPPAAQIPREFSRCPSLEFAEPAFYSRVNAILTFTAAAVLGNKKLTPQHAFRPKWVVKLHPKTLRQIMAMEPIDSLGDPVVYNYFISMIFHANECHV